MASTYTVNIGIEKPGTGDQSGTWGNTTNTNFDIIDQATNGVATVTLAAAGTSGSPNTLLINNGALSDGRNRFIEFNDGADLGATAYVQLDPNDAEKIVHIRNSLSGSRSLILFQGTYNASNDFEVPNGADVLVKFDGGGTGATVTDVNVNLTPTKLTTGDLDVDNININGNTISSTDTNGNITLAPNGTGVVAVTGNGTATITTSLQNPLRLTSSTGYSRLQLDNSADLDAYSGVASTGQALFFETAATERMRIDSSGNVGIGTASPVYAITAYRPTSVASYVVGENGSGVKTAIGVAGDNGSLLGTLSNHDLRITSAGAEQMRIDTSGNVGIGTASPASYGRLGVMTPTANFGYFGIGNSVGGGGGVNIGSYYGTTKISYIDTVLENGTPSSEQSRLQFATISGGTLAERMRIDHIGQVGLSGSTTSFNTTGSVNGLQLHYQTSSGQATIGSYSAGGGTALAFHTNTGGGASTEAMRINSSGSVGIGTTSITSPFVVNTAFNSGYISQFVNTGTGADPNGVLIQAGVLDSAYILRLTKQDATDVLAVRGTGRVGIGTTSPQSYINSSTKVLHLKQDSANGSGVVMESDSCITEILSGSNASYFYNYTSDPMIFGTNNTERLRIDSSGRVGIGTSSPTGNANGSALVLEVHSSGANPPEILAGGQNAEISIAGGSGASYLWSTGAYPLIMATNATERLRIDSSGNLLVASSTNVGTADHKVSIQKGTSGRCLGLGTTLTSATIMMSLVNGNGTVGSIQTNGTSTSYVTSSDYRLKTAVEYDWDATTRLKQLNPVRFNFIADADTTVDGFLAHEVQDVVPEAISGTKDGMRDEEYEVTPAVLDEDGNEVTPAVMGTRSVPDYQGIDQSKLVPLLVKTIQELEARIAALEAN
jgi:hypothetical protein